MKDWYQDHELYHKIGYLITCEYTTINKLYMTAQNIKKSEFRKELNRQIKKSMEISRNYAELSYNIKSQYESLKRLLLLFNTETVRKLEEHSQRFPFYKFKLHEKDKKWSLEHIHAQESQGLRKESEWREWIELHLNSLKKLSNNPHINSIIEKMEELKKLKRITKDEFDIIYNGVTEILSPKNSEYIHSIGNLALLNTSDNAALSN